MANRKHLKNKVYGLRENIRQELNARLLAKEFSLNDILDFVNNHPESNVKISQSGLNRYAKVFDKEMKDSSDIEQLLKIYLIQLTLRTKVKPINLLPEYYLRQY